MNYSECNLEKQMAKQRALTVFHPVERNRRRRLRRDYRKKEERNNAGRTKFFPFQFATCYSTDTRMLKFVHF